jgi:hypothetical protein
LSEQIETVKVDFKERAQPRTDTGVSPRQNSSTTSDRRSSVNADRQSSVTEISQNDDSTATTDDVFTPDSKVEESNPVAAATD